MARPRKGQQSNEVTERNARIAALALKGHRNVEICRILELPEGSGPVTVSKAIKRIRTDWKESALVDFDSMKSEQLARLRLVEHELWLAWEASKEDSQSTTVHVHMGKKKLPETELNQLPEEEADRSDNEVTQSPSGVVQPAQVASKLEVTKSESLLEVTAKSVSRQRQKREGNQAYAKLILDTIKEVSELMGLVTKPGELTTAPPVTGFKIIMPDTKESKSA